MNNRHPSPEYQSWRQMRRARDYEAHWKARAETAETLGEIARRKREKADARAALEGKK